MKYLTAIDFILKVASLLAVLLGGCKLLFVTCAALDPLLTAVLAWMSDHALVGGLVLAIGFLLFWFGEECERQIRKERRRG